MPILRNWRVLSYYSLEFEKEMLYLTGQVYNDKRFQDGAEIRTSAVIEMTKEYARTKNTEYILE